MNVSAGNDCFTNFVIPLDMLSLEGPVNYLQASYLVLRAESLGHVFWQSSSLYSS
jgi:hypothetical protein